MSYDSTEPFLLPFPTVEAPELFGSADDLDEGLPLAESLASPGPSSLCENDTKVIEGDFEAAREAAQTMARLGAAEVERVQHQISRERDHNRMVLDAARTARQRHQIAIASASADIERARAAMADVRAELGRERSRVDAIRHAIDLTLREVRSVNHSNAAIKIANAKLRDDIQATTRRFEKAEQKLRGKILGVHEELQNVRGAVLAAQSVLHAAETNHSILLASLRARAENATAQALASKLQADQRERALNAAKSDVKRIEEALGHARKDEIDATDRLSSQRESQQGAHERTAKLISTAASQVSDVAAKLQTVRESLTSEHGRIVALVALQKDLDRIVAFRARARGLLQLSVEHTQALEARFRANREAIDAAILRDRNVSAVPRMRAVRSATSAAAQTTALLRAAILARASQRHSRAKEILVALQRATDSAKSRLRQTKSALSAVTRANTSLRRDVHLLRTSETTSTTRRSVINPDLLTVQT